MKTFGEILTEVNQEIENGVHSQTDIGRCLGSKLNAELDRRTGLRFEVNVPYSLTGAFEVFLSPSEGAPLSDRRFQMPRVRALFLPIRRRGMKRGGRTNFYVGKLEFDESFGLVKLCDTPADIASRFIKSIENGLGLYAKTLIEVLEAHTLIHMGAPLTVENFQKVKIAFNKQKRLLSSSVLLNGDTCDDVLCALQDYGEAIQTFRWKNGFDADNELALALSRLKRSTVGCAKTVSLFSDQGMRLCSLRVANYQDDFNEVIAMAKINDCSLEDAILSAIRDAGFVFTREEPLTLIVSRIKQ